MSPSRRFSTVLWDKAVGVPEPERESFLQATRAAYLATMRALYDRSEQSRYFRWISARALLNAARNPQLLEQERREITNPWGNPLRFPFRVSLNARRSYLRRYGVGVGRTHALLEPAQWFAHLDAGRGVYDAHLSRGTPHGDWSHLDQLGIIAHPVAAAMHDHGDVPMFMRVLGHSYLLEEGTLRGLTDTSDDTPHSPLQYHRFAREFLMTGIPTQNRGQNQSRSNSIDNTPHDAASYHPMARNILLTQTTRTHAVAFRRLNPHCSTCGVREPIGLRKAPAEEHDKIMV